jgi:WD40 repeat protein
MDDNTIMSGSYEGIIKIWMDNPIILEHSQYVKDFDFNDKFIVAGSSDCNAYFWDAQNYTLLSCNSGHKGYIHKVKIFNNNKVITAGYDKLLLIWDLESRTILREFTVSSHAIKALAIKNNIIAVGTSAEIKLLDLTGKILEENTKAVEVVDASFTGREILAYIADMKILNFRLPDGRVLENRNPETFVPHKCSPAIKFCLGFFR